MSIGRVKYARNGDVRLAYREMGDGDIPVVLVPGWVSNVDLYDDPTTLYAGVAERLSRHVRLIVWDKRGRASRIPSLTCRRSTNAWTICERCSTPLTSTFRRWSAFPRAVR